jgi:hypothetical protein
MDGTQPASGFKGIQMALVRALHVSKPCWLTFCSTPCCEGMSLLIGDNRQTRCQRVDQLLADRDRRPVVYFVGSGVNFFGAVGVGIADSYSGGD